VPVNPYQDRLRILLPKGELTFPGVAEIEVTFAANAAFTGRPTTSGLILALERPEGSNVRFDRYTGWIIPESPGPPDPYEFTATVGNIDARLRDELLEIKAECNDRDFLLALLFRTCNYLPEVLNVEFRDPPVIVALKGRINGVEFETALAESKAAAEVVSQELQARRFSDAWRWIDLVSPPSQRRLARALDYFLSATRLARVGSTPWEFLAEVMLNLAKALETLFPDADGDVSRDSVRAGLSALGYDEDEIEADFLPAMALRANLDVAHVALARIPAPELHALHMYAHDAEEPFRGMFVRLFGRLADDSFALAPYKDRGPTDSTRATLARLVARQEALELAGATNPMGPTTS